jgi:hypothetical protein
MVTPEQFALLTRAADKAANLSFGDTAQLNALLHEVEMLFRHLLPGADEYIEKLKRIKFFMSVRPADHASKVAKWNDARAELTSLVSTAEKDLTMFPCDPGRPSDSERVIFGHL